MASIKVSTIWLLCLLISGILAESKQKKSTTAINREKLCFGYYSKPRLPSFSDSRIQNQGSTIINSDFNTGFKNTGNLLIQMKKLMDELVKSVTDQESSKAEKPYVEKANTNAEPSDAKSKTLGNGDKLFFFRPKTWGSYHDSRIQNQGSNVIGSTFNTGFYNSGQILVQMKRILNILEKKITQQKSNKAKSKPGVKKTNVVSETSNNRQEDTNSQLRYYPEEEDFETDAFETDVY